MKTLPLYQVDAFAERLFAGNPAAVCPLSAPLPEALMQAIAGENNLSETAFFWPLPEDPDADFQLRWFTPTTEVELCGHATLASAWVLYEALGWARPALRFRTQSAGVLGARREGESIWIDLPARPPQPEPAVPEALARALGAQPVSALRYGNVLIAVYEFARTVEGLKPDFAAIGALPVEAVGVTAAGVREDFVSRYFAPKFGIDEDPVTGSAHCMLAPYWGERLGRGELQATQLSARRGQLHCRLDGERVWVGGAVQPYLTGEIRIPE